MEAVGTVERGRLVTIVHFENPAPTVPLGMLNTTGSRAKWPQFKS